MLDMDGKPSLLKRDPTNQFFHPYLTIFGIFTLGEEMINLLLIDLITAG